MLAVFLGFRKVAFVKLEIVGAVLLGIRVEHDVLPLQSQVALQLLVPHLARGARSHAQSLHDGADVGFPLELVFALPQEQRPFYTRELVEFSLGLLDAVERS